MTPRGRCHECRVNFHPICRALAAIAEVRAGRASVLRRYAKGRVLLDGHRVPDAFGIVVSGVVRLQHVDSDGRQHSVGFLFPGDYIGPSQPLIANLVAEAATPVEICSFPRRTFDLLVARHATLEPALLAHSLLELDEARTWMRILAQRPAPERIARFLILLEQRTRGAPWEPRRSELDLPMSRTEMADYLGIALATVSRQFAKLRDEAVIEVRGRSHLRILDWDWIDAMAAPLGAEGAHD